MNTSNFKTFVEALEALPASIKSNDVDMNSTKEPAYDTVGSFAGLISIVAEDIPELKQEYKGKFYDIYEWQYALNKYLKCIFRDWAKYNYTIWDNKHGGSMFFTPEAFGIESGKTLTHYGIIVHLRNAYDNWVKFENEVGHD